ncbi:MAG: phospholipase D family protein [archaeon]
MSRKLSLFVSVTALLLVILVILVAFSSPFAAVLSTTRVLTHTQTVTVGTVTLTVPITGSDATPDYEVHFSPNGGCEATLIDLIRRANRSIHVMVFTITLNSVGDALVAAHRRGVDVQIVMDRNEIDSAGSEYNRLKAAGVAVRIQTTRGLMHNKATIIDGETIITGSYNWTNDAETSNNENMLIVKNTKLAIQYESEFQKIWNRSTS